MVKKIFHIADIHIPNNESKRPYMDMLKQGIAELYKEVKKYNKDEVRIVVAGDIFHNKIKVSNEATKMFHNFLNYLNAIAKTIIIAGNHDMLENNKDRVDSITPTFDIKNVYDNIIYADKELNYKSGYIVDENIIWAIYSIFDNFSKPNIEGLKEEYKDSTIIGLYHGDIAGAVTDTGRVTEHGINTEFFKECDCVMAGHIHKKQEIKKHGVPLVYSGSFLQQNSGENTTGHGFLEWDVETLKYKHHEVTNNYRMFKFKITSYDDIENDTEKLINL
nr:MAG TPA: putative DNA double strand break repair [Caudoviricetes sp.]